MAKILYVVVVDHVPKKPEKGFNFCGGYYNQKKALKAADKIGGFVMQAIIKDKEVRLAK